MCPDAPSIDLSSVIRDAVRQGLARVHTGLPAVVVSYDRVTQRAHVQPVIRGRYTDGEGGSGTYRPPVLPNVPVIFPSATGVSLTWDLSPGDPVWLMCAERSTDEWRATGEADITPADFRRFSLSDAVAIPGGLPSAIPATGYAAGAVVLQGTDVRLGSSAAVLAVVLESFLSAFAPAGPAGPLQEIITGLTAVPSPVPQLTALLAAIQAGGYVAAKVKAE